MGSKRHCALAPLPSDPTGSRHSHDWLGSSHEHMVGRDQRGWDRSYNSSYAEVPRPLVDAVSRRYSRGARFRPLGFSCVALGNVRKDRRLHLVPPPNKRLKLTGGDRSKGSVVLCPWRGTEFVPRPCAGDRVARSLSAIR